MPRRLAVRCHAEHSTPQPPRTATAAWVSVSVSSLMCSFRFFVHYCLELEAQGPGLEGYQGAGDGRGRRSRPGGGRILSCAASAFLAAVLRGGALAPSTRIASSSGFAISRLRRSSRSSWRGVGVGMWRLRGNDRHRGRIICPNGNSRNAALSAASCHQGRLLRCFSVIGEPAKERRCREIIVVGSVSQR